MQGYVCPEGVPGHYSLLTMDGWASSLVGYAKTVWSFPHALSLCLLPFRGTIVFVLLHGGSVDAG